MTIDYSFLGKLDLEEKDIIPPEVVVREFSAVLKQRTGGAVVGKVEDYDGTIWLTQDESISSGHGVISEDNAELGPLGGERRVYEFYLSTPNYKNYEYRVFFMYYGYSMYPVSIILDPIVADELHPGQYRNDHITCVSRENLEKMLSDIMNTGTMISVMQGLIDASLIYKDKPQKRVKRVVSDEERHKLPTDYGDDEVPF